MTSHSWIRRVFSPTPRTCRKARARVRPAIECLEDRLVPASITLSTLTDTNPMLAGLTPGVDPSAMTLRDAIMLMNVGGLFNKLGLSPQGAFLWSGYIAGTFGVNDTITIPSSLYKNGTDLSTGEAFSTIRLIGTQLPTITSQFTIVGDQTLVGPFGGVVPVWYISGENQSRVFQVGSGGNLTLENLTINHGFTPDNGGAILNQGALTLENVTLTANKAASGGSIASTGPSLTVDHSIITGNTASVSGGGVVTSSPTVTFTHDQISGNAATDAMWAIREASPFNNGTQASGTGTGYRIGDILTVLGGIFTQAAQLQVTSVVSASSGAILSVQIANPGSYTVLPTNPVSVSGGSGNNDAAFNLLSAEIQGGSVEGGGIDITAGNVSISFTTISGNTALGGGGGPGSDGASPTSISYHAFTGQKGANGDAGGNGTQGGMGGQARGGGISVDHGALTITNSTLSGNTALGGPGGDGGNGGNGAGGQDGGPAPRYNGIAVPGGAGGAGGPGGNGGKGGAGGPAQGGGLFVALDVTKLTLTNTTVADNQAIGGQGGRSGAGGNGGNGGNGGVGPAGYSGAGGVGGAAGSGATTGAPGSADGAGIHFDPSSNTRQIASSTIAFNNVSGGASPTGYSFTEPDPTNPLIIITITVPALGPKGGVGLGGLSGDGVTRASSGATGHDGTFGAPPSADGGGLYENDAIFGVGLFNLTLINSIVAANTQNTSTASDIFGTLAAFSAGDLIGTGGAGGLVNGTGAGNQVGVSAPGLLPLGNYGGETQTVGLRPKSPAIHGGQIFYVQQQGLTTDQRGFPRTNGGVVDIGAFELQPPSFVVTTLQDKDDGSTDPGVCHGAVSLRDVIAQANASSTPQTITFTPGLTGTITLTLGELKITNSMTIDGPGANLLSISGNHASRVFEIDNPPSGVTNSTISGLSIINGTADGPGGIFGNADDGGGILNLGTLTLDAVVVSHNTATGALGFQGGGGIFSAGSLTITGSTISDNCAHAGGGIAADAGSLIADNSTIVDNTSKFGGGIFTPGLATPFVIGLEKAPVLINVTLAGNRGSGFYANDTPLPLTVENTIIADGLAGEPFILTELGGNLIPGQPGYADPKLGPLQDNGGPTPTMALLPGSPAIDAGDGSFALDAQGNPLTTDQRGFQRINGANVDLGAYEVQQANLSALVNSTVATPYNQTITATQAGYQASWGTFTFSVIHGSLPPGLNLSSTGVLSGIPTTAGTFTFTVLASDLAGFGTQQYSVTISPAPSPVVDTLADNFDYDYSAGHLSLREALYIAQLPGVTTPVTFAPGLHGTITLSQGPLVITGGLDIQGPGANVLTIDGGGHNSVFNIAGPSTAHPITTSISGLTITNASHGAGITNTKDTLSLSDVVVTGNSADGIDNDLGVLHVVNSTISSNLGSGIVDTDGQVTLVGSTVTNNNGHQNGNGGGISVYGTGGPMEATLTAVNTTIADNAALLGGGIYASGTIVSGFAVPVQVTLTNVTVAGNLANDGAGIYNSTGSTLTLYNTIVAANIDAPDLTNDVTDGFFGGIGLTMALGANLVESVETVANGMPQPVGSEFDANPAVISADPKLGPLQNNGGPTQTMALLPGSPAIDAGDDSDALDLSGNPLTTDQRGFPRINGARVELGALELTTPMLSVNPVTIPYGTALANGQLSGTVSVAGNTLIVPGTFTYTSAAGTVLAVGANQSEAVTFTPSASSGFTSAATTVTVNIVPDPTFISLQASSNTTVYGQSVTFTATVTSATGAVPTSSDGTVTFYDGAMALGTVTLSGSPATASLNTMALTAGPHTITARYNADGNFVASSSGVEPASGTVTVPATGLNFPVAVQVDGSGDVIIADYGNGRIVVVTPGGFQFSSPGLFGPTPVAADGQGDVFIADPSNNRVLEVKTDGTLVTLGSGLLLPAGVAVDGQGDLFIADSGNNRVLEMTVGVPVTVSPAPAPSITVTGYDVPYDGNAHTATGTATGVGGVDLSAYLSLTGTAHTNAMISIDTWTFHDPSGNYQDAIGIVSDNISPVSANPSVTGYSVPYDGNAHTAVGSATDIHGNPLPASDFVLTATTRSNAGTSTDSWSFHDPSDNYLDASGTVSDSISSDTPAVQVSGAGGIYNGAPFAAADTVAGVVAGLDNTPAAQLEGVTPTLTYYAGTFTLATLPTTGGSNTAPSAAGNYTVLAFFPGSTDYGTASALATFTISPAATKTSTVGLSSTTAVYGQPITLTVTVSNTQTTVTPSGSVGFFSGGTELGAAPVDAGGTASLTISTLAMGKHAVTALFSDPAIDFVPSGSPASVSVTINKDSTSTALLATTTTPVFGQAVTFTATVTANTPSIATPTGSVTFKDGSTVLGTVTLSGGSASFTTGKLAVGGHAITATYNGTANLTTSSSTASPVTVGPDATTATLTSSVASPVFGQSLTLKATVTAAAPGAGKPTGTVSFYAGATLLGTATLSSGTASIKTTALSIGANSVTVVYSGDANFVGTTSAALAVTVNQDATVTKLTSSSATAAHGTSVTLTATVQPASPGSGTPTGTVSFWDGATLLGTVNLSGGVAQLKVSFTVTGKHKIKAVYNGDADFLASISALLTETIT